MSARLTIPLALLTGLALVVGPASSVSGQKPLEPAHGTSVPADEDDGDSFLLPIEIERPPLDSKRVLMLVDQLAEEKEHATDGEDKLRPAQWDSPGAKSRESSDQVHQPDQASIGAPGPVGARSREPNAFAPAGTRTNPGLLRTARSRLSSLFSGLQPVDPFRPDDDAGLMPEAAAPEGDEQFTDSAESYPECVDCGWTWQLLPDGLLYKSYLAGTRESRISAALLYETDDGWIFDTVLGGRSGVLRYGTPGSVGVEGWQLDVEGAAFTRLNVEEQWDVDSADFRFGVPLTYRRGCWQWKTGYYHISAHAGDEFLVRHPGFQRINYVRDSLFFGLGYFPRCDLRLYGEVGYAFKTDGGAEPLEIQFGADYTPLSAHFRRRAGLVGAGLSESGSVESGSADPTCGEAGFRGGPYAAINVHLRQEVDFGGGINLMAGWMWRGPVSGSTVRAGLQYYNGKATQYAFFQRHEELLGFGLWYDY